MAARKLSNLYVENFKKISFLDMVIGDHVTEISGKNGSGKSTAFHAIQVLLEGLSVAPSVPIRTGAEQATIRGKLGDLIVERTFRPGDDKVVSHITLRTPEGAKFPSPQKHLDEIIGSHILDPIELIQNLLKKPAEVLQHFVPDVDFAAIDRANLGDFDRRTAVNRLAKEARGAAGLIVVPPNTPDEPVDDSALVDELQRANDHNALVERRKTNRENHLQRIESTTRDAALLREQANDLRRQAAELDSRASAKDAEAAGLQQQYDGAEPLPAVIDLAEIRTRIDGAKAINAAVQKRAEKVKHEQIAAKYERESMELTDRMAARDGQKQTAIAQANLAIPDVGLADGVFLLNKLPFEQASHGEQLRTAFAFIVASDPDAELRLAWIHDAAVLDDDTLQTIDKLSHEFNVQVLLETIRPTTSNVIVLEDGHVQGVEQPAPKPPEAATAESPPFDLSGEPPPAKKKQPRRWQGPGAPVGEQS